MSTYAMIIHAQGQRDAGDVASVMLTDLTERIERAGHQVTTALMITAQETREVSPGPGGHILVPRRPSSPDAAADPP